MGDGWYVLRRVYVGFLDCLLHIVFKSKPVSYRHCLGRCVIQPVERTGLLEQTRGSWTRFFDVNMCSGGLMVQANPSYTMQPGVNRLFDDIGLSEQLVTNMDLYS